MQEATLEGSVSQIEAYSSNLHVLHSVEDCLQATCMTMHDWHQAQWADPVLSLVIARLQDGTLSQHQLNQTDPPKLEQYLWKCNHLRLRQGILYWQTLSKESKGALFKLVLPAAHRETALKGCHGEVGHLGLECMLDLMHDHFFWPHIAAEAREHINKCHPCFSFKGRQPRAPLENTIATHPLELIHLDYLCLEPGKGKGENILVVTDHFTWCAQAYVPWSQTAQTKAKAL